MNAYESGRQPDSHIRKIGVREMSSGRAGQKERTPAVRGWRKAFEKKTGISN